MSDNKEKDQIIEGHEYDGIQELNNPLPRWWLVTFYLTMIFAAGYYGYYELAGGPSLDEQLEAKMTKIQAKHEKTAASAPAPTDIDVQAILSDPAKMAVGQKHYVQVCAACHGQKGEGSIGPNLTDNYWLHSKGDFAGIMTALREGFPTKGMPPWKDAIPVETHAPVVAYVMSLRGTQPPNAKEPQGELVEASQ